MKYYKMLLINDTGKCVPLARNNVVHGHYRKCSPSSSSPTNCCLVSSTCARHHQYDLSHQDGGQALHQLSSPQPTPASPLPCVASPPIGTGTLVKCIVVVANLLLLVSQVGHCQVMPSSRHGPNHQHESNRWPPPIWASPSATSWRPSSGTNSASIDVHQPAHHRAQYSNNNDGKFPPSINLSVHLRPLSQPTWYFSNSAFVRANFYIKTTKQQQRPTRCR